MAPTNSAARITAAKAHPLKAKEAPYTSPTDNELVIRDRAIALNPVDFARQLLGTGLFPWTTYPAILGTDIAGEVIEVGARATSRFKVGDRVGALGSELKNNNPAEGAFQDYVVLQSQLISQIPPTLSFEGASVIPSTASCGLFQKDHLALQFPTEPPRCINRPDRPDLEWVFQCW